MSGEARVVWMPGGVRTEVHLSAAETAGAFCMLVDQPPPGWSLPPHRHANEAETVHVVEGEFEMQLEGRRVRISAGETVHIRKGEIHSGANVGASIGRRILIFSPAGMEEFFLEAGAPSAERVDGAAARAAAARHGWEFPSSIG
jgi:quercetin dioxygenase-like cupin family protein